ncbi:hypothetical protein Cgig2_016177 [Carnegiea gigantea]|uniref:Pentatricopeptide repeat-containing protein n=1 Tax=Carnegiea gigantea TaxID=171969 RepID=A0A9Q1KQJ2_9CARY|nr:hypothetical protein Cgig2_016177 [Carnegiea gigantea]
MFIHPARLAKSLRSCIKAKSLNQGKLIHQKTITLGLQNHIALCHNLINLYFSCHSFQYARLVFQNIDNPLDIRIWNGLLAAYTKKFMFNEALELFEKLLHFPHLKSDFYTYPSVFKACAGLAKIHCGKMLHAHVIKNGVLSDVVVASSIVGMYAKCDVFEFAYQLFDEMSERDVACWNTVISGCYQCGQFEMALKLYEQMKVSGVSPNSTTLTTVISSCTRLLDLERGKEIHRCLIQDGFQLDTFVGNALVDMYGKCGCLEMARDAFEQILEKDVVSYNSMISGHSFQGDSLSCMEIFRRMSREGIKPSPTTFSSLLIASSRSGALWHGKFVHGFIIRNGAHVDIFIDTLLIDFYFKCSSCRLAENVFKCMPKTSAISWNTMISGYLSVGFYVDALTIFREMRESGVKPDPITFASIINACSQLAALEQGKEIHSHVIKSELETDIIVMGAVLDMYARCGAMEEALGIFNQLPKRDLAAWTSLIMAYGSHGRASDAIQLFESMKKLNIKPDEIAFLSVLSACGHAGLVEEGLFYFNQMVTDYGIEPMIEHYSCLIDLLQRAGRLQEAYEILQKMPNIRENTELLCTLLSGCNLQGDLQCLVRTRRNFIGKDPDCSSSSVVLAKTYASLRRWDDASMVRLKARGLGLKKTPGCSWIEVDRRIEQFLVEDKSHEQTEMIRDCLGVMQTGLLSCSAAEHFITHKDALVDC